MRNTVTTSEGKRRVNDRTAFKHYRENSNFRKIENTRTLSDYSKIVTAFYTEIGNAMVESEGGVFIKNLGYFSNIVHPKKQVVKVPYTKKVFANFKTKNYLYLPTYFGFAKGRILLNFWAMDRTFSRKKIRARVHKALVSGVKYKTYIATLSSLYLLKK